MRRINAIVASCWNYFTTITLICVSDLELAVEVGRFTVQDAAKHFMIRKMLGDFYVRIDEDGCYSVLLAFRCQTPCKRIMKTGNVTKIFYEP